MRHEISWLCARSSVATSSVAAEKLDRCYSCHEATKRKQAVQKC